MNLTSGTEDEMLMNHSVSTNVPTKASSIISGVDGIMNVTIAPFSILASSGLTTPSTYWMSEFGTFFDIRIIMITPWSVLTLKRLAQHSGLHRHHLRANLVPHINSMSDTFSDPAVPTTTLLTLGPTMIGSLVSYALFGISIMQIYLYHINFPRDSWKLKTLVYVVFVVDIFQSIAAAMLCWKTLVAGWGRESAQLFPGWTLVAPPACSGVVALFVQSFYAWRIHFLGKWRVVPCVIIFFALAQCAAAQAIAIGFASLKNVELLHKPNMNARTIVWLGGAALTDLMVSLSMLYWLYGARHSHFSETQRVIQRLIRLTIETGVATATTAVLELVFFTAFPPTSGLHLLALSVSAYFRLVVTYFRIRENSALSLCKVYSNALMTSLNSRVIGAKHSLSIGDTFQRTSAAPQSQSLRDETGDATVTHFQSSTSADTEGDLSSAGGHDHSLFHLGQLQKKMGRELAP